ncbi:uncharacterized protein TNCV_175211 [Trichonephila clavipes]|nr:uncharacterized protein TNCV_175211 [Trichonephila clavipes]
MLIGKLESVNITTKQAKDDANVIIVETAIEELGHHMTAVIVGEDIDLLVILLGRTQTHQEEVFFKKVGKENVKTQILSSKSFDKYPHSTTVTISHTIAIYDLWGNLKELAHRDEVTKQANLVVRMHAAHVLVDSVLLRRINSSIPRSA